MSVELLPMPELPARALHCMEEVADYATAYALANVEHHTARLREEVEANISILREMAADQTNGLDDFYRLGLKAACDLIESAIDAARGGE